MYPYHLLPKADKRQAADEERKRAYDPLSSIRVRQPEPKRRNPIVPLVVFTAFGVREAEELRKRLENTPRPVDMRPQSQSTPSGPPSSIQAPSANHGSEHRQNSRRNRDISNAAPGGDKPKDKDYKRPPAASEPSLSDLAPDAEEESETNAFSAENTRSYEDIFLSMNAVDLSYYSSLNEYDLVRDAAISLRHEKLILFYLDKPREYLKRFATYTWDEEADAAAEEFIQWYVERFRPDLERQLDILTSGPAFGEVEDEAKDSTLGAVEEAIEDLTNDERESVIAIDLKTGETLFVRYGDEDSVTVQERLQKLVEERDIILLHNHPNNSPASLADLDVADWLDAEYMIVVNQDGTQHHYARVGGEMMPLAPVHNPAYVAESDPMETLAADVAYWVQTLSELGDPPEMVMEQGVAPWWQEENIIVPYRTDETMEEVAARMGMPSEHLERVNDGKREEGIMYIPLPGWHRDTEFGPFSHHGRTMRSVPDRIQIRLQGERMPEITEWWGELSTTEQNIEMALTATADDWRAGFDNIQSFESAVNWIARNNKLIETYAANVGVPKELLQTVHTAEILYDYGTTDAIQDNLGLLNLAVLWQGTGVGNVHYVTLMDAYKHTARPYQMHPWYTDLDAPNLSAFPLLEEFELPEGMTQEEFDDLPKHVREAREFQQREMRYDELDFGSVRHTIGAYLATNEGTINAASLVTRMYMDEYLALDGSRNSENLSAEDMARIWGRYRTSYEPLGSAEFGPNAQLALPLAEYFLGQE